MNILSQSPGITVIVENKCSGNMPSTHSQNDSDYSLLSVYETSENPLIRELVGTYTLDSTADQAA